MPHLKLPELITLDASDFAAVLGLAATDIVSVYDIGRSAFEGSRFAVLCELTLDKMQVQPDGTEKRVTLLCGVTLGDTPAIHPLTEPFPDQPHGVTKAISTPQGFFLLHGGKLCGRSLSFDPSTGDWRFGPMLLSANGFAPTFTTAGVETHFNTAFTASFQQCGPRIAVALSSPQQSRLAFLEPRSDGAMAWHLWAEPTGTPPSLLSRLLGKSPVATGTLTDQSLLRIPPSELPKGGSDANEPVEILDAIQRDTSVYIFTRGTPTSRKYGDRMAAIYRINQKGQVVDRVWEQVFNRLETGHAYNGVDGNFFGNLFIMKWAFKKSDPFKGREGILDLTTGEVSPLELPRGHTRKNWLTASVSPTHWLLTNYGGDTALSFLRANRDA